jgi:esterase/lipase superfamily enzyme
MTMQGRWLAVLGLAAMVACGPRGDITIAPTAAQVGSVTTVFVGTTRTQGSTSGRFGSDRRRGGVGFARYDISIPPDRAVGEITWPRAGGAPDIRTDFVTTGARTFPDASLFRADLRRTLMARPAAQREVVVFTHGFNTTFAEGLYRIAQMGHDIGIPGVLVHYAWPSAGKPLAYVRDRDSALFARDGLETLLNQVADAGAQRIVIVGHSMGAALTMETLRQMAIRGDRKVRPRIGGVVLLSPDLDVDVFHAQARAMGKLPQPFYIFTSRRDKALALSARLTGQQRDRLGNLRDLNEVADLEVTVVDVAGFSVGDGHLNVAQSPALIGIIGRIADINNAYGNDASAQPGLLPGAIITLRSATAVILSPVTGGSE